MQKKKKQHRYWYLKKSPHHGKVQQYIEAFDAIAAAVGSAPTTIMEWSSKMKAGMQGCTSPHLSGSYMKAWHIRSYMLACMHREKVQILKVENATLNALVTMNPDASGNMKRLRSHFEVSKSCRALTAALFLKKTFAVRPELLSMWCCLALDRSFKESDFSRFENSKWQAAAQAYYQSTNVHPHPAVPS